MLCEHGYFKELCFVVLVSIHALRIYEMCDYVISILTMMKLWNLMIIVLN